MAQLSGHVERLWREYADALFKDTPVSTIQYQETRLAFISGMYSCFELITGDTMTTLPDDESCRLLSTVHQELHAAIAIELQRRRALSDRPAQPPPKKSGKKIH